MKIDEFEGSQNLNVTGSADCILMYNQETILRIEPKSIETKLNELLKANQYVEAVNLVTEK